MTTSKTGLVHGTTIELDSAVPEMEGKRVRVVLEVVDEPRLCAEQQRELWRAWVERGPQGPIDDGPPMSHDPNAATFDGFDSKHRTSEDLCWSLAARMRSPC